MSPFSPWENERMTLREACTLAVGIVGGHPTTTDVWTFLALEGWRTSRISVGSTLRQLRGAAVEVAVQGEAGFGHPTRWRLTEASRAWIAAGERC
jgi:hypothetical protein